MSEHILEIAGKSDEDIKALFAEYQVALTPDEGRQIQKLLGRNPTLTEGIIWGIQGSEHSSYKSSRNHLKKLPVASNDILLGPGEDAGIVRFWRGKNGKTYGIAYAHESHNHPSQIVPYEGAATGVGGICRDILCMGARVIGAMDALRFGDIKRHETQIITRGVVDGVGGYGNPLGVPNLGGDAFFDPSFNDNCLVNVVALGVLREEDLLHSYVPEEAEGYELILVGKPTDRSGFGGSAFASAGLSEEDKEANKGAVQEPNPFLERHVFAGFQDLFARLKEMNELENVALKDLGAGGVLCATIELVAEQGYGAEVDVHAIHVAEEGLPAPVILCAETQERFCLAVPPRLTEMILEHFNTKWDFPNVSEGAMASKIGTVVKGGTYRAKYEGEYVCNAKAVDITEGIVVDRPTTPVRKEDNVTRLPADLNLAATLEKLMAHENIASRKPFYETYDQTVQGNTVLTREETEAVSFTPLRDYPELSEEEQKLQAAVAVAGSAFLGRISPRLQGQHAVALSTLRLAAVGAKALALTDCLNYGNPEVPEQMWELTEGIEGLGEMARELQVAFVSGNVSLYNNSKEQSVNPSAVVSALGRLPLGATPRKKAFQKSGSGIYLLGTPSGRLGGSQLGRILGSNGNDAPMLDADLLRRMQDLLLSAGERVSAAAVVAEGGLMTTVAKMAIRGEKGFVLDASLEPEEWFCEDLMTVLEVSAEHEMSFELLAKDLQLPITRLGAVTDATLLDFGDGVTLERAVLAQRYWNTLRDLG